MFGLHKYLDRIYQIKWIMNENEAKILEELMFVKFEKKNEYFLITEIHYTYVDILLALEGIDFEITKNNNEVILKIIKI